MSKQIKKTTTTLLGLSFLVIVLTSGIDSSKSVSSNNGITGQTTTGCGGCHSGGQSGTVTLTGLASTVLPSTLYTFNLVYTPTAAQKYYGLDIKASAGTLAAGTGMKKSGTEVTHTAPFGSATATASNTYTGIKWTSPAVVGAVTFSFACVAGASTGTQSGTWQKGTFATSVVLPVEFLSFNVTPLTDNRINIVWKTATEINTDHFEVEKSMDGRNFNLFGKVSASGNSQTVATYSLIDMIDKNANFIYYRIKSIDKDGRSQYSNIQTFCTKNTGTYVNNIYPNPAKIGQDINVEIVTDKDQIANIILVNSQGKIISSKEKNIIQGSNKVSFKLGNFILAGNYYMLVKIGNNESKQIALSVIE